jgi:hypothetical protein
MKVEPGIKTAHARVSCRCGIPMMRRHQPRLEFPLRRVWGVAGLTTVMMLCSTLSRDAARVGMLVGNN